MNNRTALDIIMSVVIVGFLAVVSYKWLKAKGPLKYLGGLVLAILIADILATSNYWINGFSKAVQYENLWSAKLEGWKHVSGLA
jgi:hypothetical protein